DPADQLAHAALALGRSDLPAEIFRDHDVGRLLRPAPGNLDVALFEHDVAALIADDGGADVPLDLVERIDARLGDEARKRQAGDGCGAFPRACLAGVRTRRLRRRPDGVRVVRFQTAVALHGMLTGTGGVEGSAILHVSAPFTSGPEVRTGDRL